MLESGFLAIGEAGSGAPWRGGLGGSKVMCRTRGCALSKAVVALSSAPTTPHEAIKSKGCSLWLLDARRDGSGHGGRSGSGEAITYGPRWPLFFSIEVIEK